ncbi:glycosyltransferase involved in cell wall biosynthesis [Pedobacter sp. UYP24]
MAKRKQINLIYRHNDNWIGGTYYILNIIRSLKLLDDQSKPELVIFYGLGSPIDLIEEIQYPFISYKSLELGSNLIKRVINKIFQKIKGKTIFKLKLPENISENVYPLKPNISDSGVKNAYYWIPDFQELYYPEFFSKYELRFRNQSYLDLLNQRSNIVFSSVNASNDFDIFFPGNVNKKKVLNFASFIGEDYKALDVKKLVDKFNISDKYLIVSNQFWKHKNHKVVLEALKLLKNQVGDLQVVFTGKEYDHRNPDFVNQLKTFIEESGITNMVKFLGFIDRDEQLALMDSSVAVIQPSLFEGWSTVIEDAKVLNHFVLVSDIALHREQIKDNCLFFDPNDPVDLASKITSIYTNPGTVTNIAYKSMQIKFANDFINLFK